MEEVKTFYDVIIIGGGPAGMTAAIYASRAGMRVLIIEKESVGGQMLLTEAIANYPGFQSVNGAELAQNMLEQVTALGVEIVYGDVEKPIFNQQLKMITVNGVTFGAHAIILSMGAKARPMSAMNEEKFVGKGISYCAICDGAFFRNKTVAVVGGANTALQDAIYLSSIAKKVYLVHRKDTFSAEKAVQDEFFKLVNKPDSNIELKLNYVVSKVLGEDRLSGAVLYHQKDFSEDEISLDGIFVAVGRVPSTEFLSDIFHPIVDMTKGFQGYIKVDENLQTNVPGVFAAGDVREKELRQIVTAISDGAIAGTNASQYVKKIREL